MARRTTARAAPKPRPIDMVLPEQRDKGEWAEAQGFDMREKPVINLAEDMIGRLGCDGRLTPRQVDAARQWQEIRAAWIAELGTQGYQSCLVERTGGYDGGDGDIKAIRNYYQLRDKIGRVMTAVLQAECDKGRDGRPHNMAVLRNALDAVAE